MEISCPICIKSLTCEAALKTHTGTTDPSSLKTHVRATCSRRFCNQRAIDQDQESWLECKICEKKCRSRKTTAVQKTAEHANELDPTSNTVYPSPRDQVDFGDIYHGGTTEMQKNLWRAKVSSFSRTLLSFSPC
jgi:hypothetical protein